jgi:hypothetical protein
MSISGIGQAAAYIPIASAPNPSASSASSAPASMPDPTTDPVGWLMDYTKMTPAQQMQASILHSLGLTQQQYDALPPAEKAKIDAKIQQMIKQQVEQQAEKKTGMVVDMTA